MFDESDQQTIAPAFRLVDSSGKMIALNDFYEKGNLVLLFIPMNPSPVDLASIESIINHQARIRQENANLLVLSPQALNDLGTNQSNDFLVFSDTVSKTRENYSGLVAPGLIEKEDLLIFILDAYGAPSVCLVGQNPDGSVVDELLSWLLYLSIQCPE